MVCTKGYDFAAIGCTGTDCTMWKFLFVLIFGSSLWFLAADQDNNEEGVTGRPVGPSRMTRATAETCVAGDIGAKCADCRTQLTCSNTIVISTQVCSDVNPNTPYCVNNVCVSYTDNSNCLTGGFRCTGTGQFPDPNNCRRYYLCSGPNGNAYAFECPQNFIYDSKSGLCKRFLFCQTIDCSRTPNQWIVYAADQSVLAFCRSTSQGKETILFRCPDPQNRVYNATSLECTYKCTTEGRFVDKLDCHSFYECYIYRLQWQVAHQTCPTGFSYNQVTQICEARATCQNEIQSGGEAEEGSGGGASVELLFAGIPFL